MTSISRTNHYEEAPAFFPAGGETLFGILTRPTTARLDTAVVILPGGAGTRLSSNRNRWSVRLARQLASYGFHALRFDYHGAGESTGLAQRLRMDRPYTEDVEGAIHWLSSQGLTNFVLIGSCFGARTALSFAPRLEGIQGVVLVSPPVRDFGERERTATLMAAEWSLWRYVSHVARARVLRGLTDPKRRQVYAKVARAKWRAMRERLTADGRKRSASGVSSNFLDPLTRLVERQVPVLFIYGEQEDLSHDFNQAVGNGLGDLLKLPTSRVDVRTLPGAVHGFRTIAAQDATLETVTDWLTNRLPAS